MLGAVVCVGLVSKAVVCGGVVLAAVVCRAMVCGLWYARLWCWVLWCGTVGLWVKMPLISPPTTCKTLPPHLHDRLKCSLASLFFGVIFEGEPLPCMNFVGTHIKFIDTVYRFYRPPPSLS